MGKGGAITTIEPTLTSVVSGNISIQSPSYTVHGGFLDAREHQFYSESKRLLIRMAASDEVPDVFRNEIKRLVASLVIGRL